VGSLNERTRLSRALNDLDIRIHSNLASSEILQATLEGFVQAIGADAGDIKLREGDEWVVRYEVGFGTAVVGERLKVDEAPLATAAFRAREPVVIADYTVEHKIPYIGFPREHGLRSGIVVPLIARGEVVGCLFAWMRDAPRNYSAGERDFARRMAASVALALDNARLYEAEQKVRLRVERAERRLKKELGTTRILLKASDDLTSTMDPDELLDRMARIVLEATGATRAFINLVDTNEQVLIPKVATDGLVSPVGTAIPFAQLSRTSLNAIREKRSVVLDYEHDDTPEYDRQIARANRARVMLFVPMLELGEIIGHITIDQPDRRYRFSAREIRIVESIAAQSAVALQNARQFEREHRIAETLQHALLAPPGQIEGLEVSFQYMAASAAASVGGDFYDVHELGDDRVAFIVGDVAGKGLEAAQLTALMRDGARAYLIDSHDPAACFTRLNALAYRFTPTDKFATAFLGVLDRATGELAYCGAAHPSPVVITADGVRSLDSNPATLLGAFPAIQFTVRKTILAHGDVLVMFTDGVTEARQGSLMLGETGLTETLERLREIPVADLPHALLSSVIEFAGGRLQDDAVVLCVSRSGSMPG